MRRVLEHHNFSKSQGRWGEETEEDNDCNDDCHENTNANNLNICIGSGLPKPCSRRKIFITIFPCDLSWLLQSLGRTQRVGGILVQTHCRIHFFVLDEQDRCQTGDMSTGINRVSFIAMLRRLKTQKRQWTCISLRILLDPWMNLYCSGVFWGPQNFVGERNPASVDR